MKLKENIMKALQIMMKSLLILLIFSCGSDKTKKLNQNKNDSKIVNQNREYTTDSNQNITPAQIHGSEIYATKKGSEPSDMIWSKNTTISKGTLWRKEKTYGSNNWSDIVVSNIFGFKETVSIGEIVQVVPLRKELPIIKLSVIQTRKRNDFGDTWYEVDLEKISKEHEEYWSINTPPERSPEFPSDLLIIYPVIKNCTRLQGIQFETKDLPVNISNDMIQCALDFNGDKLPDVLGIGEDAASLEETYIKLNNEWINSSALSGC